MTNNEARKLGLFVVLLGLPSCKGSVDPVFDDADIAIRTDRTAYQSAELIIVPTTNASQRPIYDDHCGGEVQGFEFLGRWNASYGAARACAASADGIAHSLLIPAGSTHLDTLHVNARAYTGTWRVRLHLRNEGGSFISEDNSTSNTFRVEGSWTP